MGITNSFDLFGFEHNIGLLLLLSISFCAYAYRKRLRGQTDLWCRRGLAGILISAAIGGWIYATSLGYRVIPLNFCDLALFAGVYGLLTLHRGACHLVYFWGLAGSLQALLTPDLHIGFPSFRCLQFFVSHTGIVVAAIYLAVSGRVKPSGLSLLRIWLLSNLYLVAVGCINWVTGANFGYLSEKPSHPSMLDYMGDWPYYLISIEVVGTLLLLVLYWPVADRGSVSIRMNSEI